MTIKNNEKNINGMLINTHDDDKDKQQQAPPTTQDKLMKAKEPNSNIQPRPTNDDFKK